MRRALSLGLAGASLLVIPACPKHVEAPAQGPALTDAALTEASPWDAAPSFDAAFEAEAAPLALLPTLDAGGDAAEEPEVSAPPEKVSSGRCREQPPQEFLIRGNYMGGKSPEDAKKRALLHQQAIRYRTERYGWVRGFGKREWNPHEPAHYAEKALFFGLPIQMHKRVVPALHCVEAELKRACKEHPYKPSALAGIRYKNTFRGGEVTNHAYAIAIDIDPSTNTCCGCVAPWNNHPACKRPSKSEYDRMSMPECWVHVFERFGFYWLGHDVLKDTMHFEFLGDPDKILER